MRRPSRRIPATTTLRGSARNASILSVDAISISYRLEAGKLPGAKGALCPRFPRLTVVLLGGQFATLATVGPDGRPQLSEVWFLAEDDTIGLSLNPRGQKTRNLMANPAANLFLLDLVVPYRYLEIRGDAQISPDDDYFLADRLHAKYGADARLATSWSVAGRGRHPPRAGERRQHEGLTGSGLIPGVIMKVGTTVALASLAIVLASAAAAYGQQGSDIPAGNDVSYPQCGITMPTGQAFGIVAVNDGLANTTNPCLAAEIAWAQTSTGGPRGRRGPRSTSTPRTRAVRGSRTGPRLTRPVQRRPHRRSVRELHGREQPGVRLAVRVGPGRP